MKLHSHICITLIGIFATVLNTPAQPINPDILSKPWEAFWITAADASESEYGVYYFRKSLDIQSVPEHFVVHISADNRYKLYVNEKLVSAGPARGDQYFWNFETIDLAPYLIAGNNTLAAVVWNEGALRPEAQISWRTGFILQGNTKDEWDVNTNESWKAVQDEAYQPISSPEVIGYYVTGPGEFIDLRKSVRNWKTKALDDSDWPGAVKAYWRTGAPKGLSDAFGWMLVPSVIPHRELTPERLRAVRESTLQVPDGFLQRAVPFSIPPRTRATLLLDQGHLTNAYVTLLFSQGKNASIGLKYTEALFIPANSAKYGVKGGGYMGSETIYGKGNRNEVEGKVFLGKKDSLISNGSAGQEFTSLYWRTYRYVQLTVVTQDEPLVIDDLYGTFTGYPFTLNASFASDNPSLQPVLDIGWRTARLCAIETYFDCPFYEQLQYIGDTRIQAMVSYYNSGDDRLVRNAINLMDHSRIAEGVTLSRHPSFSPQLIPTFSLWYIGMLYDYWMYRPDSLFVKDKLAGTRDILWFFGKYEQADGSLKGVPYWLFTDWVEIPAWNGGVAPVGNDGCSSALDLQLLLAYQTAARLEEKLGMKAYAEDYRKRAAHLQQTIQNKYWDESKGLFADTPEKTFFSQHANALALLTGTVAANQVAPLAGKLLTDPSLAPASIYFKYYLHQALVGAGLGNDYLSWLGKWFENIDMGLSTWAEDSDVNRARSDCHAWGASPNIEFYRIVLGIDTDAPGFSRVRIEPHLGKLKHAAGEMPHPAGNISVDYTIDGGKWNATVNLPGSLTGTFVWAGKAYMLKAGRNQFVLD